MLMRKDAQKARFFSSLPVRNLKRSTVKAVSIGVLAVCVSGCGLSSLTSGLSGTMFGGSSESQSNNQVQSITEEQLLSAAKADVSSGTTSAVGAVAHGCPKFKVWPRDNHVTIYEDGRVGDGLAIMHRGEITKVARECSISPGRVTVKYGFSGRVLLGPRGRPGVVNLPVSVFVADGQRQKIATEKLSVAVSIMNDKPIGYFSTVQMITFDIAQGSRPGEYEVFVAFDRKSATGAS